MAHCIDHLWVPMSDGAKLGARLWLPNSDSNVSFPTILEYIPYRKDDYSAVRDSKTIAWFADHCYACLRVDMRGSGSSDGVLLDEYSDQEIDDGVDVINWIAKQSWSDGNVGTIGISWGGITGLQLAQRQPKPLKTIIVLGATEFRYYDDAGYYMGCMVGQTIGWAAMMFGYNSRPPDPALVGEDWEKLWMERLEQTPHYLEYWLNHQREDDYWLRGTVGTDYDAIDIPVYAASGHADCWPNTVSRLLENLNVPRRGLQGAWCHRYPHLGIPGPTVGFLPDALRWFDQWLKGEETGIMDESMYQVYMQDSIRPEPFYESRPGKWIGQTHWPFKQLEWKSFNLSNHAAADPGNSNTEYNICSPQTVGLKSGEYMPWFTFGPADELPADQRVEDEGSLCFDIKVDHDGLAILGRAEIELELSSDKPQGLVAVRLCDVWPDGESTLITRGILNLSQRESKAHPEFMTPGKPTKVTVQLNHVGYSVPAGHKLRLAISTSYWPIAWPSPAQTTLSVYVKNSQLKLPVWPENSPLGALTEFQSTETGEALPTTQLREFKQHRNVSIDPESGQHVFEIYADNGKTRFDQSYLEMASTTLQRYTIHRDNPLTAKAEYEWEWEYGRDNDWRTKAFTRTQITCDQNHFFLSAESVAWKNDEQVFSKTWNKKYPRDHF